MSSRRSPDARLPKAVAAVVDGQDLDRKVGLAISLIATGDDGWPRLALLSAGEVLSTSGADLRLALYGGSRTSAALTESGRALLNVVLDGTSYKIYAEFQRVYVANGPLAYFHGQVTDVDEDRVGYATITSGITFELADGQPVLDRWSAQIERLRGISQ